MKKGQMTTKLFSLLLALCMLLSVSAFAAEDGEMGPGGPGGASTPVLTAAADFADYSSISNKEAVGILVKLNVLNGYLEGDAFYFKPAGTLTRAEMAALIGGIATIIKGDEFKTKTPATFSDMSGHWAQGYVEFGYDGGYIDGMGDGTYAPEARVTGHGVAKLLLAAMGNKELTGTEWTKKVEQALDALKAEGSDLLAGVKGALADPITRDDMAQLCYNALITKHDGLPNLKVYKETTKATSVTIGDNDVIVAPEGKLVTLIAGTTEVDIEAGTFSDATFVVTEEIGQIGSFGGGDKPDDYLFRTGLYITKDGIAQSQSATEVLGSTGKYSSTEASGLNVNSTSDNFNGIIVDGTNYTIKDSTFKFISDSDGSRVNDFSGLGAVVSAFNGAIVTLDNVNIETEGVARLASFTDEYAHTIIKDSTIKVMGGDLYDGYVNTADQSKMVAPPWVLGITGNARATNLEGNCSSTVVLNSDVDADQWGVISTDAGQNMQLFMVDSKLTLLGEDQNDPFSKNFGSGYATYAIGSAQEYFYGVEMNVGTYATIFTGGYATYASSNGTFDVYPLDTNAEKHSFGSQLLTGFGSEKILSGYKGAGKNTVINSDAFGFMAHGKSIINVIDNTVVNTNNAVFLLKVGDAEINLDNADINVKDGVLLQMMDNDDSLVGAVMGAGGPNFNTVYNEAAGWHEGGEGATDGGKPVVFNATNITLDGNLYNGTGNYNMPAGMGSAGGYGGNILKITLGKGAILNGTASATAVMHVDENGKQRTSFTSDEYYYLGHMANKANYNGVNGIEVVLKDGAVWNVTEEGIITSLTVGEGCTFNGIAKDADGKVITIEAGKTYTGIITISAK